MRPRPHSKMAWAEAPNLIGFFPPDVCTQGLEVKLAGMQAKTETGPHLSCPQTLWL